MAPIAVAKAYMMQKDSSSGPAKRVQLVLWLMTNSPTPRIRGYELNTARVLQGDHRCTGMFALDGLRPEWCNAGIFSLGPHCSFQGH